MKRKEVRNTKTADLEMGRLSKGNVFEDLGFADPETELVKADLVLAIADRLERLQMSQRDAAERLGTTQPKVSMLLRGHTKDFSVSKLIELLNRLSCDVEVSITPVADVHTRGKTRVVFGRDLKEVAARAKTFGKRAKQPRVAAAKTKSGARRGGATSQGRSR